MKQLAILKLSVFDKKNVLAILQTRFSKSFYAHREALVESKQVL